MCVNMNSAVLAESVSRLSSVERDALLPLQKMLCLFVKKIDRIAPFSSFVSAA